MSHTRDWNNSTPANTDSAALGAQRMREIKVDVQERMSLDHLWDVNTDVDGLHKQVTLPELMTDPTVAADQGVVYTKDVDGVSHLFFRSSGTTRKLTGTLEGVEVKWENVIEVPEVLASLAELEDPEENSLLAWDNDEKKTVFLQSSFFSPVIVSGLFSSLGSGTDRVDDSVTISRISTGLVDIIHNLDIQGSPARLRIMLQLADGKLTDLLNIVDYTQNSFRVACHVADNINMMRNRSFFFFAYLAP